MKLRSTCRSNRQLVAFDIRHVECYKLPVASTCCLLPFDMLLWHVKRCFDMSNVASICCLLLFDKLLRHVADVDGALRRTLSPQRGLKTQNSHFPCKIALRFNKVCCIVSLCENFHWQSCTAFTGISIRVKMNGVGCFLKRKFYISWTTPWCGSRTD